MTAAEVCFVTAAMLLVIDVLPGLRQSRPLKFQSIGLALIALGLALVSGLAFRIGLEGDIF